MAYHYIEAKVYHDYAMATFFAFARFDNNYRLIKRETFTSEDKSIKSNYTVWFSHESVTIMMVIEIR